MEGYRTESYGDAFADVYDDWYGSVTDVAATVALVVELAGASGRVLELGVGTGRLAIPLARAGLAVTGIDSSAAMLERCRRNDPAGTIDLVAGDMVTASPVGPFDVVLAAYNTVFNLVDPADQAACFAAVAERLGPGGRFVVEAFTPDELDGDSERVEIRTMTAATVVLAVSRHDSTSQIAEGHFIEFADGGTVRLRPWMIRYHTSGQLDAMAAAAGLVLEDRRPGFHASGPTSLISIYRRGDDAERRYR